MGEYFCMWNERRHEGHVTEVGGGCKSDHSCLDQMTENFKWETINNRFAPTEADLCNFKDKTAVGSASPAGTYFGSGSTETFPWFDATNQYAGLYSDGQYHRLFMIAIQTALGSGILVG